MEIYTRNALLFLFYALVIILLVIGYRLEIYMLINEHYPDFRGLGFLQYLNLSGYYDSTAVLYVTLFLFALIAATIRKKKIFIVAVSLSIITLTAFLLISIDFFKTYETTFQTSFLGKEHATALTKILVSFYSEMTSALITRILVISAVIIMLTVIVSRDWFYRGISELVTKSSGRVLHKAMLLMPFTLLIILAIIKIAGASEDKYLATAHLVFKKPSKVMISNLHEFSYNPLYNLLAPEKQTAPLAPSGQFTGSLPEFFNTTSRNFTRTLQKIDSPPRGKKYNVVLFFFESTPSKYLNITVNGRHVAPNWLRLMKNSFVSLDHYANYPLSANALLSVLTSSYSMFSKEPVIEKYPDVPRKTASEILKEKGYRTCLLHTGMLKYAGQDRFLKKRKFDRIIQYQDLKKPPYEEWVGWGLHERSMIEPSIQFMKEDTKKPFFVIYMPVNPHHPYAIPDNSYNITGPIDSSLDYREKNWLKYCNSLYYCDAILGELVDRLEKEGLMENTLFFLFSDHGEAFYQHRQNYNHPLFIYEENVRVPFLIYNKQFFPETVRYQGISSHIDILPTILDILSIETESPMEGISLFSRHQQQMALIQTTWKENLIGIRDGKWKYIRRIRDSWEELYDLALDPDEKNNLAAVEKPTAEYYRAITRKANAYTISFYDSILGGNNTAGGAGVPETDGSKNTGVTDSE